MSQKEFITQMLRLSDVLYGIDIPINKTTSLSDNDGFRKFRAVVKALNIYVDIGESERYDELGDE